MAKGGSPKSSIFSEIARIFFKPVSWLFTNKYFRWFSITLLVILVISAGAISESIKEGTPVPFIKTFGGFITGADTNINEAIDRMIENPEPSFWEYLRNVFEVFGSFWLIYILARIVYWPVDKMLGDTTPVPQKILVALVFMMAISLAYKLLALGLGWETFDVKDWNSWFAVIPFVGAAVRLVIHLPLFIDPALNALYKIPILGQKLQNGEPVGV